MTPIILFKFATRSRPMKFLDGLKNITSRIADKENYKILVTADSDDASMNNELILNSAKPYTDTGKVKIIFGTSISKIDAINRDMETENDWHILVNYSDDMEFIVDGFDNIIRGHFQSIFPDFYGNVYYNDGYVGDKLSTMSIIGKAYFDTILEKKIYRPEYMSLFSDNEYTEVAKKLNKIAYFDMILYRHNHPANIQGLPMDEQYVRTEGFWHRDSQVYETRKSMNFGLNI